MNRQSVVLRVVGHPLPIHLDEMTPPQVRSNVRGFNPTGRLPGDWEDGMESGGMISPYNPHLN